MENLFCTIVLENIFIVDLAVGVSAAGLKAGPLNRGEYVAKYNRLMEIVSQLLKEL